MISQDLDELEDIAGRIAVMFSCTLSTPMPRSQTDRESIGLLMGGGVQHEKANHAPGT